MDFKQKIELILKKLKEGGIERKKIAEDLKYSKNYFSQALSRKGNKKLLNVLETYAQSKLPDAINNSQNQQSSINNTDSVDHELRKKWTSEIDVNALMKTLLEEKDRTIKKEEERALKAEEQAKNWETLYQDEKKEKSKLFDIISDIVKGNLSADNLKYLNQQLSQLNDQTDIASNQLEQPKKISGIKKDSEKKNKGN